MTAEPGALAGLLDDLEAQRRFVEPRAPVYARVLERVPKLLDGEVGERLAAAWAGRRFGAWYERPLLLLASIRDDALREGPGHPLWRAVGDGGADVDAVSDEALREALAADREHLWRTLATRHLQTNDPSRAVTWLWPAALLGRAAPERPLHLYDVGASAGLNLVADGLPAPWKRADGSALAVSPLPPIVSRTGHDLRPLDVRDDVDARWLRACVWPGQADRLRGVDAAIAAFRALGERADAPRVEPRRAAEVPGELPIGEPAGPRVLVYQSILRDYLPDTERRRYEGGMRAWLETCAPGSALWVELEVDHAAPEGGPAAAITAHVAPGGGAQSHLVARCDPHPEVIHVDEDAVAALAARV